MTVIRIQKDEILNALRGVKDNTLIQLASINTLGEVDDIFEADLCKLITRRGQLSNSIKAWLSATGRVDFDLTQMNSPLEEELKCLKNKVFMLERKVVDDRYAVERWPAAQEELRDRLIGHEELQVKADHLDTVVQELSQTKALLEHSNAANLRRDEEIFAVSKLKDAPPEVFKACALHIIYGIPLLSGLGAPNSRTVILRNFGSKKINCIKAIRESQLANQLNEANQKLEDLEQKVQDKETELLDLKRRQPRKHQLPSR